MKDAEGVLEEVIGEDDYMENDLEEIIEDGVGYESKGHKDYTEKDTKDYNEKVESDMENPSEDGDGEIAADDCAD